MVQQKSLNYNENFKKCFSTRKRKILIMGGTCFLILVAVIVFLAVYFTRTESKYVAGVVTNGYECSKIGASMLEQGGSAVDAAIAALFCEGIAMPQSMGLGGGFFMTIYDKENNTVYTLNARETAPLNASWDMYLNNSTLSAKGGLAVAVPAELKGYWYAHQRFGKLPWSTIVQPSIDLCKNGHYVTSYLDNLFAENIDTLYNIESLREIFINPETNDTYHEGDHIKREKLAETLEIISVEGASALYNGCLTAGFVKDIQNFGGIITERDLLEYEPYWEDPVYVRYHNYTLYTTQFPSSGAILGFMLNVLDDYLTNDNSSVTNWQRIVETLKYGYGRKALNGDPNFVQELKELTSNLTSESYATWIRSLITDDQTFQDPSHYGVNARSVEDHGTAHICVKTANGDAVSVTSTINLYFGAKIRSQTTGIILNDEMDDFVKSNATDLDGSLPAPNNFIEPGKRPASSISPLIIIDDNGEVKMVVGAAGGTKITSSLALIILRHLIFNEDIQEALNSDRLHHPVIPMEITFENNFNKDIVNGLAAIGHNYTFTKPTGFSAVTALTADDDGYLKGATDPRRSGQITLISA